jgi:hypothetical protein
MSEIETPSQEVADTMDRIAKAEEDKMYRQGLSDFVAGRRDTEEARFYVAYWTAQTVGNVALQPLAE